MFVSLADMFSGDKMLVLWNLSFLCAIVAGFGTAMTGLKELKESLQISQKPSLKLAFWFIESLQSPCQINLQETDYSAVITATEVPQFEMQVGMGRGKHFIVAVNREMKAVWHFVTLSVYGNYLTACIDWQCQLAVTKEVMRTYSQLRHCTTAHRVPLVWDRSDETPVASPGTTRSIDFIHVEQPSWELSFLRTSSDFQVDFSNNLSLDYLLPTGERVMFGLSSNRSYPDMEILDPIPSKERGVGIGAILISSFINIKGIGKPMQIGAGITIAIWVAIRSSGEIMSISDPTPVVGSTLLKLDAVNSNQQYLLIKLQNGDIAFSPSNLPHTISRNPEWALIGLSARFQSTQTIATVFVNNNYQTFAVSEPVYAPNSDQVLTFGFIISEHLYRANLFRTEKSMADIAQMITICGISLCPVGVTQPIPTCSVKEYVDSNGRCQPCLSKCQYGCVRPTDCTLCDDPLCYRCSTFGAGTCSTCVPRASFVLGLCTCDSGTFQFQGECIENCPDGFYLDENTCVPCGAGCLVCNAMDCFVCNAKYLLSNGSCVCASGYYLSNTGDCNRCSSSCGECNSSPTYCTKCWTAKGYVLIDHTCKDCSEIQGYIGGIGIDIQPDDLSEKNALNTVCKEICGDGLTMGQLECDDGNLIDGDGCSSKCTIEPGWECTIPIPGGRSLCVDIKPPTAILVYLSAKEETYYLNFTFSEEVTMTRSLHDIADVRIEDIDLLEYKFGKISPTSFTLAVTVYESVASHTEITVSISNPSEIKDEKNNVLTPSKFTADLLDEISLSLSSSITKAMTSAGGLTSVAASGAVISSVFGGTSMNLLWSFIEALQLINYLVYLSAALPENLRVFLRCLNFANFEFVPSFFSDTDDFESPPTPFRVESVRTGFLTNCGNMATIWIAIIGAFILALVLSALLPAVEILQTIKSKFVYSVFLRGGIESFLQVWLAIVLQFSRPKPGSISDVVSLAIGIVAFILIIWIISTAVVQVALPAKEKLKDREHQRKFHSLYQEMSKKNRLKRSFLLIQLFRKVMFVLVLVFLTDYCLSQSIALTVLTALLTASIIFIKPFKQKLGVSTKEIISESIFTIALCLISVLSADLSISSRSTVGWVVIALLLVLILMHFVYLGVSQYRDFRRLFASWNSYFASRRGRTESLLESERAWVEGRVVPMREAKDFELEVVTTHPNELTFQPDDTEPEVDGYRPSFKK